MPISIAQNPETHVALLVDSSGSMMGFEKSVVDAVNKVIADFKAKASTLGQTVIFSLYSFGGTIDALILNRPIAEVHPISLQNYRPDGGTPMLDAINLAVDHLESIDSSRVANLVTIITDGQENTSRLLPGGVKSRISKLTLTDRYTFSAMVPRNQSLALVSLLGLAPGNVVEWNVGSTEGIALAASTLSAGYGNYLQSRSVGATKSSNFFEAKIDPNQAKLVKQALTDVQTDFKQLPVTTNTPKVIKAFVEYMGLRFMKGRAFYQLTKPEKVQHHKEVLLKEIKTGKIYGGSEAREILGLPQWKEVKVKPADFSDWQIFVQSTSDNRKLMDGTTLLWLK